EVVFPHGDLMLTKFAVDLFQQIRRSEGGNIFYSPLSIMSALAMTYLGSRGHTASEIRKVEQEERITGKSEHKDVGRAGTVHRQFQRLLTELNKPTNAYELSVANRLYGDKEVSFSQDYLENVKKFYLASVASVDFVNAAEESRQMINSWVESQTKGKIKDLFPKGTLSSSTTLVLVNAIYFKGRWLQEFKKENTSKEKFWLNKVLSISYVQNQSFQFASLEHLHVKILEIPYTGQELSMLLLLPDEVDGLQKLEEGLTAEKLLEWTSSQNMKESQVDLHLPRFKVEENYKLMAKADADFSGMTGRRELAISSVVHKSFVEVTEEGTEAAAATGVVTGMTSAPLNNHFHCDHPFLFFIRHNKTNSILFCGRVSSP
uniref:Serpin domain-containing protein n=1 Tax=Sus scrofa TaxID=9823 RepID=A0A4X1U1T9_PIG